MSGSIRQNSVLLATIMLAATQFMPAQADRGRRGSDDDDHHHHYSTASDRIFSDVETRLFAQGFRILRLEYSDGMIEAKGYSADGACVEVYFDRSSGEEVFREPEDNCHRYTERPVR